MAKPDGPRPPFVPDDFDVPRELVADQFRLEPLGPQHNAGDYEAWTSSMDHIKATPGFAGWGLAEATLRQLRTGARIL